MAVPLWGLAAAAGLASAGWAAHYSSHLAQPPQVQATPGSQVARWVVACRALFECYRPPPWCTNGHFQTIFASLFRRSPRVEYHRELARMSDGGSVALDWTVPLEELRSASLEAAPTLIILHGVTGGSAENYVKHMAANARAEGWVAVVFNQRGCGDSKLTSPRAYCAASSDDCREVVAYIHRCRPSAPLLAVGFSMGANVLVKYLGEVGNESPLRAAVSLANPLDTLRCGRLLDTGLSRLLYSTAIVRRLQRYVRRHSEMVREVMDTSAEKHCRTVWEFDHRLTAPAFGFADAEAYYRAASSLSKLSMVETPLLCVNAEDDPIAPADPAYAALASEHVAMVTTRCGGHIAWLEGWWPLGANWADRV
eukprot:EG_transcript_17332